MKMKLPHYDKSTYRGKGDRAELTLRHGRKLKIIFYEGWMLGFKPLPTEVVKAVDPQLETVNKNLEAYYDAWDKFIKAWIVKKIQDPSCVYRWRLQFEQQVNVVARPPWVKKANVTMLAQPVKPIFVRELPIALQRISNIVAVKLQGKISFNTSTQTHWKRINSLSSTEEHEPVAVFMVEQVKEETEEEDEMVGERTLERLS